MAVLLYAHGISANYMAWRLGLDKRDVSHFVKGDRIPSDNVLRAIAHFLNVVGDPSALLTRIETPVFTNAAYDLLGLEARIVHPTSEAVSHVNF